MAVPERFVHVLNLLSYVNAVLCQRAQRLCEVSAASSEVCNVETVVHNACMQPASLRRTAWQVGGFKCMAGIHQKDI